MVKGISLKYINKCFHLNGNFLISQHFFLMHFYCRKNNNNENLVISLVELFQIVFQYDNCIIRLRNIALSILLIINFLHKKSLVIVTVDKY